MSKHLQVESAAYGLSKSPVGRRTKSAPVNRKCVVVGQKMVKTEEVVVTNTESNEASARLSNTSLQDVPAQFGIKSAESQSPNQSPNQSPSGSIRSSGSSFLGTSYGGLDVTVSSNESTLLDDLRADIELTAAQLVRLKLEVETIPLLRKKVEEAEKEKKMIAEDLSERCEVVKTMKQRLSVLHEQNSQLAQLTQSSSESSSETTLRMRNALVASLAQLKKLQGIVDEVPGLKSEISTLKQENLQIKEQQQVVLKQFSISLPDGATPLDYTSLQEENEDLKNSNESLHSEIIQLSKSVEVLSDSLKDMEKRVVNFEKSVSNSIPLSNQIKKLEKDKEDLYDEIIQVKLGKSISQSIGNVYKEDEIVHLRKVNSGLQSRFDELALQYKQQKGRIVRKLFEIEVCSMKCHKFEVEKRLSDMDLYKSASPGDEEDRSWTALPPQFKAQILKLHQLQLQNEQSHHVMQLILSEKEDLERDLAELGGKLEAKSVAEVESRVKDYERKLTISHAKITELERQLHLCSQTVSTDLVTENAMLKSQLSLHTDGDHAVKLADLKKQLSEEERLHEVRIRKYKKMKDQNQKLEAKLKEGKSRYHIIASDLANSVQLTKKYQIQCINFEKDIEVISVERESFSKEVNSLKAELEVIKAEYGGLDCFEQPQKSEEPDVRMLELSSEVKRLLTLKFMLQEENIEAKKMLECKVEELESAEEKFKDDLYSVKDSLAIQQASWQKCIEQLEAERVEILKDGDCAMSAKRQQVHELKEELLTLSSKLKERGCENSELRSQLDTVEKDHCSVISRLSDSETKLSQLLAEIDRYKSENSKLLAAVSNRDVSINDLTHELKQRNNADDTKYSQLHNEIEGYSAIIKSLQRQLDEAETRELEHELLKRKIHSLERSLGDSSHDNKALLKLLHDTVHEIPSFSQAEQSLQDRNLQLEEQVSVLSQWNDKQRQQIEELERTVEDSSKACNELVAEVNAKEELLEENLQLKRELKEVEIEVNSLRRQVQADIQEELQIKLEAKTQLLAVFNQHNTRLQQQVEELQSQVKGLGGKLDREKAASPPPMPDIALSLTIASTDNRVSRSKPSLEKENLMLKQRIKLVEEEVLKLHVISADVRRCASSLHALSSISLGSVNEEVLVSVPREMLLPCSLLADHINLNASLDDPVAQSWIDTIQREWFECVSQRTLTPARAQSYVATLSQLSHKLLDVVVNLQDMKGNTALHFTASNGNLPAMSQFLNLRSCDPCILNEGGYNALMLLSASTNQVNVTVHREILDILIERSGVNTVALKNQRTALMLASSSGNSGLVNFLLEKGSGINYRDKDGSTALMFATQRGHNDIVKKLVSCPSCDTQARDNEGQTAKDIANVYGYHNIVSLVKKTKS